MNFLKQILAQMPNRWTTELKRIHFSRQIRKGTFITEEPEGKILSNLIAPGDWVIDIGANVGHYTKRFSELVGPKGRVLAFEPVPATFSLLSANAQLFTHLNVTLINAAVSNEMNIVGMSFPKFPTGLTNFYQARLSSNVENHPLSVLTLSLDSIGINHRIALVKIDAEKHESFVLSGMQKLLEKYHPFIILETDSKEVIDNLLTLGYVSEKLPESPNIFFKPQIGEKSFKGA
jgi:FkbM family methyltransferase